VKSKVRIRVASTGNALLIATFCRLFSMAFIAGSVMHSCS